MRGWWSLSRLVAVCLLLTACATQEAKAPITGRPQVLAGAGEAAAIDEAKALYARALAALYAEPRCNPGNHPALRGCVFVAGDWVEATRRILPRLVPAARTIRPGIGREPDAWIFEVAILNGAERNAFSLAGGKIIVYRGLLENPGVTESELAAIIAHEMAHALAQHQREAKVKRAEGQAAGAILGLPLAILTGIYAGDMIGGALVSLPHSREQESEADRIALTLLARAGYDPRALVRSLEKLAQRGEDGAGVPGWLSTHPDASERAAAALRLIRETPELQAAAGL